MTYRPGTRMSLRFLVPLLMAVFAVMASVTPAMAGEPPPLSASEQARFVEGARTLGGLTQEQIDLALKDPAFREGVVVEAAVTSGVGKDEAGPVDPAIGAAALRCRNVWVWVEGRNIVRAALYRFRVDKYFCWNGVRTTGHQVTVTPTITTLGTTTGWDYIGINAEFDRYYKLGSSPYGGLHSYRQGRFRFCPPRIVCIQNKYPSINIWDHYDGTWDYTAGIS